MYKKKFPNKIYITRKQLWFYDGLGLVDWKSLKGNPPLLGSNRIVISGAK